MSFLQAPRRCPWRDWTEWEKLFTAASQGAQTYLTPTIRQRGGAPSAITFTGQLTSVATSSDFEGSSEQARLSAAMLIVRAVNILADSVQQGAYACSISDLASRLGLPRWLVDIRHEATHGSLPSMHTCRMAREALLAWFQAKYWLPQYERVTQSLAVPSSVRLPPLPALVPAGSGEGGTAPAIAKVYKRPRPTEAQPKGRKRRVFVSPDSHSWCRCLVLEVCSVPQGTQHFIAWTHSRGGAIHTWLQGLGVQGIRALMGCVAEARSQYLPSDSACSHLRNLACYLCSLSVWRVEGPDAVPLSKRTRLVLALPWPEERLSPMAAPAALLGLRPGPSSIPVLDPTAAVLDLALVGGELGAGKGTAAEGQMRQAFALSASHVLHSGPPGLEQPGAVSSAPMAQAPLIWYM